jgi:cytochrome c peroxidase
MIPNSEPNITCQQRAVTALFALLVPACTGAEPPGSALPAAASLAGETSQASDGAGEILGRHASAQRTHDRDGDRRAFERVFPGSNGRSCATCHVIDDDTTLVPEHVEARLREDPDDPLFNRLDADDPTAAVLTFEHLKKGLIRVVLPLPDNMDVIDVDGAVVTPADRTISVWRGVPSVADVALTAPYQLDGRAATLEQQAQAAISGHAEGPEVSPRELARIARFQRSLFTSARARLVSELVDYGFAVEDLPAPEQLIQLSEAERRGREVYLDGCEPCHGGATTSRIVDRDVHDFLFPELDAGGNVVFEVIDGVGPVPQSVPRADVEIVNTGYGLISYFGQIGLSEAFNASVELPRYRFRFYEDGTRQIRRVDLPPPPATLSGDPLDPRPALDARGAPIVGPNLVPQLFTTDPGRAAITGDPADFEAFDMPPLRGIARTAPYFHDNSVDTLETVVDIYSRNVLGAIPVLELPEIHPPETPGGSKESLDPGQKQDLLAFLKRL